MTKLKYLSYALTATLVNMAAVSFACIDDEGNKHSNKKKSAHTSAKTREVKPVATPDEGPDSHVVKISSVGDMIKGAVSLEVKGMRCSSCKEKLEAAIKKLPEVETVIADVKAKSLNVTLKSDLAKATLAKAIEDAGFNPN